MNFKTIPCQNCHAPVRRTNSELKKSKTGNVFCCKSCAAQFNNKTHPKRQMEGLCKCGSQIRSDATYCKSCFQNTLIENKTYGEFTCKEAHQRNARVRIHARNKYRKSGLPQCCVICGYSKHIDVAHVKDISSFSESSLISEINDLKNLVALCKNHHWEFDQDLLDEKDLKKLKNHLVGREGIEPPLTL